MEIIVWKVFRENITFKNSQCSQKAFRHYFQYAHPRRGNEYFPTGDEKCFPVGDNGRFQAETRADLNQLPFARWKWVPDENRSEIQCIREAAQHHHRLVIENEAPTFARNVEDLWTLANFTSKVMEKMSALRKN